MWLSSSSFGGFNFFLFCAHEGLVHGGNMAQVCGYNPSSSFFIFLKLCSISFLHPNLSGKEALGWFSCSGPW